jgi:threonine synthase
MGYQAYQRDGKMAALPKMLGYQAEGAAPFVLGRPISQPKTVATAIRIGAPQSWDKAMAAQQESQGWFGALEDEVILAVQRLLAAQEGIFCEPASAISVAGVLRDIHRGKIPAGSTVVCTLTGHGLKDPMIAMEQCHDSVITIPAKRAALVALMDEKLSQVS